MALIFSIEKFTRRSSSREQKKVYNRNALHYLVFIWSNVDKICFMLKVATKRAVEEL